MMAPNSLRYMPTPCSNVGPRIGAAAASGNNCAKDAGSLHGGCMVADLTRITDAEKMEDRRCHIVRTSA